MFRLAVVTLRATNDPTFALRGALLRPKDSVDFRIKHVQGLPISYTRSSTNLHSEYEAYAWKVNKEGEKRRYI